MQEQNLPQKGNENIPGKNQNEESSASNEGDKFLPNSTSKDEDQVPESINNSNIDTSSILNDETTHPRLPDIEDVDESHLEPVMVVENRRAPSAKYAPIGAIKDYLLEHFHFRYNQISNKIEFRPAQMGSIDDNHPYQEHTPQDFNTLLLDLQRDLEINVKSSLVKIILDSNFVPNYNPFQEYFSSLPAWDQTTDYIQLLASRITSTNQNHFIKYFKIWFIAIVACGCDLRFSNHLVLLLKGAQGVGKTRFLRHLVPESLYPQYCYEGPFSPNNKDHERFLAEKFIIIMDEYDSKTGRQMEMLKSAISRDFIESRKPYAVSPDKKPRVASFGATTNKDVVLRDSSGNRRWIAINVESVDAERFEHLDLAYSQAYYLWKNGGQFFLTKEDIFELNEANEEFSEFDVEDEFLRSLIRPAKKGEEKDASLTATDVTIYLTNFTKLHFSNTLAQKVGALLKKNGFHSRKSNGAQVYDIKYIKKAH